MGTIASRDCLRVLQLTEQVIAASLLAATQALEIRRKHGELDLNHFSPALRTMTEHVLDEFEMVIEDRPLEQDLRRVIDNIQHQAWALYS